MIDYHIHTSLCRHARGCLEEYVEVARQKGLKEIGFADHFPLDLLGFTPPSQVTMDPGELPGYIRQVRELAAGSKDLKIKLGIEVDYIPGTEDRVKEMLDIYPFDYVIGSIHFMDEWDFTHPKYAVDYAGKDMGELYGIYFDLVEQACGSGLFDIMGHIDVIKKFGYYPSKEMEPLWEMAARALKNSGTCLELNTAGKDAPAGEFYPGLRFLEICRREGVHVTMGSDAHAPERVGRHFKEGIAALLKAGYSEQVSFDRRNRSFVPLRVE